MSETTNKFAPEVRERAVGMVLGNESDHLSRWAAITLPPERDRSAGIPPPNSHPRSHGARLFAANCLNLLQRAGAAPGPLAAML